MTHTVTQQRMADWLEQAWLARYLDRQLSDTEIEWFETYALDRPELIAAIDADSDLRDGIAAARTQDARERSPESPAAALSERPSARRRHRPEWMPLALAASVCLGIGWMLGQSADDQSVGLITSPTRIFYDTTRSEVAEPVVFAGDAATPWTLVEVGLGASDLRAQLWVDGEEADTLPASEEGIASFLFVSQVGSKARDLRVRIVTQDEAIVRELRITNH